MSAVLTPRETVVPETAAAKAALLMQLRSLGVRTIAILRAIETVPRDAFLDPRVAAFAQRDIALPIGCGQTMAEPSFVARQLDGLDCTPDTRVLEIGSGTGYVTTLLARLAGEVRGVERYRTLAAAAGARLETLGVMGASVVWGDGLEAGGEREPLDRVLLHVAVPAPPAHLLERLAPGGVMVCPLTAADGRQDLVRFQKGTGGVITATRLCASRLQASAEGRSQAL